MGSHLSKQTSNISKDGDSRDSSTRYTTTADDKKLDRSISNATTLVPQPPSAPNNPLSELYLVTNRSLNSGLGKNILFHAYKNEPALFHVNVETHTGQTTISLHSGSTKKSPVLSTCFFDGMRPDFQITQPSWIKSTLTRDPPHLYVWIIPFEPSMKFTWNEQKYPVKTAKSLANPDWKLKDANTGEVHAVLVWTFDSGIDRGQLQFRRSLGEEWELGVLMTVAAIVEKERQRRVWVAGRDARVRSKGAIVIA